MFFYFLFSCSIFPYLNMILIFKGFFVTYFHGNEKCLPVCYYVVVFFLEYHFALNMK